MFSSWGWHGRHDRFGLKICFDDPARACNFFRMPDLSGQSAAESSLWAVVAIIGKIIRIAEIYPSRSAALADQAWREQQVRAYAGFLDSASQPFPRYAVKPIRRSDLPRRWKPLPALGFLRGQMF
jgi:hypothetical protein